MIKILKIVITAIIGVIFMSELVYASNTNMDVSVNVLDYGSKGNGLVDDTDSIQKVLNENNNVYIPDGTYLINVEKSLHLKSNQKLVLSNKAILKAIPTSSGYHAVIRIINTSNVTISGGKIIGERYSHKGTSGEWGMGISVENGSNNININNITITDFWGDGIYLGGNKKVTNITIDNVICDGNRRQGISLVNASYVTISNSIFKNTKGVLPEAGIDFEPNIGQTVENVNIINVQSYNNSGAGLDFMGINSKIKHVNLKSSSFNNNISYGIRMINAEDVSFENINSNNNGCGVDITRDVSNVSFIDSIIDRNKYRGVSIVSSKQVTGIDNITFENTIFSNNSQAKVQGLDGVRIDNYDNTGYIKNISFKGCSFIDNQTTKTQRYGLTVGFTQTIKNIYASGNNIYSGNLLGDTVGNIL